jgi:hypothetical protein
MQEPRRNALGNRNRIAKATYIRRKKIVANIVMLSWSGDSEKNLAY